MPCLNRTSSYMRWVFSTVTMRRSAKPKRVMALLCWMNWRSRPEAATIRLTTSTICLQSAPKIGNDLRNEYLLGYYTAATRDGKYHNVKVDLAVPQDMPRL